jgi:hypothetical protein
MVLLLLLAKASASKQSQIPLWLRLIVRAATVDPAQIAEQRVVNFRQYLCRHICLRREKYTWAETTLFRIGGSIKASGSSNH